MYIAAILINTLTLYTFRTNHSAPYGLVNKLGEMFFCLLLIFGLIFSKYKDFEVQVTRFYELSVL